MRLSRGSHAKDYGIGGKPVPCRFLGCSAGAVPVCRLEVRSSLDGSKDKDRATDHEADGAAHKRQLFRLRLIALSHRTSNFILCPPKRNDWHRNCAASATSSSRSKSPSWTSARARSNSYFRAGANSASAYPISSDLIPRSKW